MGREGGRSRRPFYEHVAAILGFLRTHVGTLTARMQVGFGVASIRH